MSRHSRAEPADQDGPCDVDAEQVYLPYAGRSRANSGHPGEPFDDLDDLDDGDEPPPVEAVRMRPAPKGLSRGDRREWQRLEVARVNRQAEVLAGRRHGAAGGWSGGFLKSPPRGLGRKGRKAWHLAEQEATRAWWTERRASSHDIAARAAGAAVLALVIGIAVLVALVVHRAPPAGSATAAAAQLGTTALTSASMASAAQGLPAPAAVVPGATGSVAVASRNAAVGVTPTVAPPLAGQWQPTPAGGVPAAAPTVAPPIHPSAVKVQPASAGAVTPADQASPQAAVTAWLARTCPSSWRDPFGADLTRGKDLETVAAWKADNPAHDTVGAALWRSEVVAHRQIRACGNLQVVVSPDQPITARGGFVLYSAERVVTSAAGGLPVTVEQLSGARRVLQQAGVWRVDIAVVGG